jgi:hypothetical protein
MRMRWSNSGATLIGPRDGALIRSPVADAAPPAKMRAGRPRAKRVDVHIHVPTSRRQAGDATPNRPEERRSVAAAQYDDVPYGGSLPSQQRFNSPHAYQHYLNEFYRSR